MHARIIVFILVLSAASSSLGGGLERSPNFDVFTPTVTTPEAAQAFAAAVMKRAEQYRQEISLAWLGEELPPSVGRTTINVSFSDRDYGLTWAKDDAQRKYHTIYLSTTQDGALNHTLAHEMVHVVLATRYPHPNRLPAWVEEGIASRYDDGSRQKTRDQIVNWWAKTGNWPALSPILGANNISADDQTVYAAAASLTSYLLTKADQKTLLAFADASRENVDRALTAHYGITDVSQLQTGWQQWVTTEERRVADRRSGDSKNPDSTVIR